MVVQNGHAGKMAVILLPVLLRRKPQSVGLLLPPLMGRLGWRTRFCFCKVTQLLPRELLTPGSAEKVVIFMWGQQGEEVVQFYFDFNLGCHFSKVTNKAMILICKFLTYLGNNLAPLVL